MRCITFTQSLTAHVLKSTRVLFLLKLMSLSTRLSKFMNLALSADDKQNRLPLFETPETAISF